MSDPTPPSAVTKRKADGGSLTGRPKKIKVQFANELEIIPPPSPPQERTPSPPPQPTPSLPPRPTLQRHKSFSLPTGKEDDNFSDKVKFDPTVFIPQYKQGLTNANQSHHESGPNNLPLNSSSNGQEGAISNESSPTNNDRVVLQSNGNRSCDRQGSGGG